MFSTEIVNSDAFLDMPASTQALYFHLGMHCDDDGFVYPRKVVRMIGAVEDDLKILALKKFVLPFESGVMVVKHWRVNNFIRSDRYRSTTHREEMAQLTADKGMVYHLATTGIPNGSISKEVSKKGDVSNDTGNANAGVALQRARESLRAKKIIS